MDRRKFLLIASSSTTFAVAGCAGEENNEATADNEESSNNETEDEDESTDNSSQQTQEAVFELTNFIPSDEVFSVDEEIQFAVTVENAGDVTGEENIEFRVDGETISEETVEVDSGSSTEVEVTQAASEIGSGTFEVGFYSEDDEITTSITIREPGEAVFELTDISPDDASIEQAETIEVGAVVENTGNSRATQQINLYILGDTLTDEITLEPGEEVFHTFLLIIEDLDAGDYEYTFATDDDEISNTFSIVRATVEQPESYSFSGTGQSVESGIEIEGGLTVIEANHTGSSNFQVSLVNDSEFDDLFINVIGEFNGAQAELIDSGEYLLDVEADGDWDIEIRQPRATSGESLPQSLSGNSPDVIGPIQFEGVHIAEGTHDGSSNFQVQVYPMEGMSAELVFNEIGEFEGETTFSYNGIGWVDINANGNWTVGIE